MKLSGFKVLMIMIALLVPRMSFGMEDVIADLTASATDAAGEGAAQAGEGASNAVAEATGGVVENGLKELPEEAVEALNKDGGVAFAQAAGELGGDIGDAVSTIGTENFTSSITKAIDNFVSTVSQIGNFAAEVASKFKAALSSLVGTLQDSLTSIMDLADKDAPEAAEAGTGAETPPPTAELPVVSKAADAATGDVAAQMSENVSKLQASSTKALDASINQLEETGAKGAGEAGAKEAGEAGAKATAENIQKEAAASWQMTLLSKIGDSLLSGFVFTFPSWAISALQSALTAKAATMTASAPQYFGGLWLQVPGELINATNPANSIPVYSLITNPNIKNFYGQVSSAWSQPGGLGLGKGKIDNNNYFVASGNYDDCTWPLSWATTPITGSSFAGQMIHLNSGLEFLANGDAVLPLTPYRQLQPLNPPSTCPNFNGMTMARFLYNLSPHISGGTPFVETYDMFSGTGMMNAGGSLAQAQGTGVTAPFTGLLSKIGIHTKTGQSSYGAESAQKTLASARTLANQLYNTKTNTYLMDNKFQDVDDPAGTELNTWDRMSIPFNLGPAAGGISLSAMQAPSAALLSATAVNWSSGDSTSFTYPPTGQGIYVYQTGDTPLAKSVRKIMQAGTGAKAAAANDFYDYLITLDSSQYNPTPGLIPQVNVPAQGPADTKPGYISWVVNPQVKYMFSLLDGTLYNASTGLAEPTNLNIAATIAKTLPLDITGLTGADTLGSQSLSGLAGFVQQLTANGPYVYGAYTVTIPQELQNVSRTEAPIYMVDPTQNNNKSTLEGGYADYVVPLDANFAPLTIPNSQHQYWGSLVSSRLYNSDLTLANGTIDFTIVSIPQKGTFIAAPSATALPAFQQSYQNLQICPKCQDLTGPLATLYMEYDINPFNESVIKVLPVLAQAIAQAISKSTDPIYQQLASAGTLTRLATAAAADFVGSLQSAGLTPTMIETMTKLTSDQMNEIASESANAITEALKQGMQNGTFTKTLDLAAPTDISNLLSKNNPAVAGSAKYPSVFAGLGTKTLASVLPPVVQQVFNALPKYAGLDTPNFQNSLFNAGLISVGPYYFYNYWSLGSQDGKNTALSYIPATNPSSSIFKDISTSHSRWKLGLMSQPASAWLELAAMGPFSFTTNGVPNVIIEATSSSDVEGGDFVYQSPTQHTVLSPGDYFIVAQALGAGNAYEGALQPFNPTNPQPLLISLLTGTVYTRDSNSTTIRVYEANGQNVKLSNLSAVLGLIKSPTLKKALNIAAQQHVQTAAGWKRYNFGNFLLTISPLDVQNNTYIYQDITALKKFPPALSNVKDFFVGANESSTKGQLTIGVPLDNNPKYIISVVTGKSYTTTGDSGLAQIPNPGSLINSLPGGGTPRTALRQAVDLLITKHAAPTKKAPAVKPPAVQGMLPAATVADLLNDTKVPFLHAPYTNLKLYNGKYYAVTEATSPLEGLSTIFDYSSQTVSTAMSPQTAVGILYDSTGDPSNYYDGTLLTIARAKAGVIVNSDGSEVLGVPNLNPGITVKAPCPPTKTPDTSGQCTLFSFDSPMQSAKLTDGTYTLYQYGAGDVRGLRVMAQFEPTDGSTGSYVDMYSGDEYNLDGTPKIAQYPTLVYPTDKTIAAAIGTGDNGWPITFAPDQTGNYQKWDYFDQSTSQSGTHYMRFNTAAGSNLAITPTALDPKTQWTLFMGTGTVTSGANKGQPAFDATVTKKYGPATSAGEQLRVYNYIGSGPVGSGTVFNVTKITENPNYEDDLIIAGTGSQSSWKVTRLFVPPTVVEGAPGYMVLTPSTTQGESGVAYATDPSASTQYNATFFDNLKDNKTNGAYVAIKDSNGVHFYIPSYQTTPGATLKQVQSRLGMYVNLTAYGDVGLFIPLHGSPNPLGSGGLAPIAAVINVPAQQANVVQDIMPSFLYEPASPNRYVYQYSSADAKQVYYRSGAAFVDLRFGVLYDSKGVPTGNAISYPEVAALLLQKGVKVPKPTDDPTQFTPTGGRVAVPQGTTLSSNSGFLWYGS